MGIIQYIGPDFYFGARKLLEGIGATGKFSVIEANKMNWGISYDGIWRTDGTGYEYISPPFIRKWIQDHVNFGSGSKIAGLVNEARSMLEWGVPVDGGSENSVTICYNMQTKAWTFRDYGITCGLKKNIFRNPIFGLSNGAVMFAEFQYDADGSALDAWVQTRPMPAQDQMLWKDVEYVLAHLRNLEGTGFYLQIGVQDNLNDEIVWSSNVYPTESSEPLFSSGLSFGAGRYISLKIGSNAVGSAWSFAGFDIYGSYTGEHI
jgi:hypothetical protein